MTTPRAVLYARVSKVVQDEGMQLDELRQVAASRGWRVVAEHVDHMSGSRSDRAGLAAVLDLVRRHRVDLVAVWRLDRLARSLRHLLTVSAELDSADVQLVSLRDRVDTTTPTGRLTYAILGAIAEFERELTRERTIAGQQRARARGVTIGRPAHKLSQADAIQAVATHGSQRRAALALKVSLGLLQRRLKGDSKAPQNDVAKSGVPRHRTNSELG